MWATFKVFMELAAALPPFMPWPLGCEACGILAPRPGIEPAPAALEDEVPTTGPPGKFLEDNCLKSHGQCSN